MRVVAVMVSLWVGLGCDSNPTPHPGADTILHDTSQSDATGGQAEPDRDNDGVGDCTEAGGFWSGDGCEGAVATPDADGLVDAGDVAPPGDTTPEVSEDAEASEVEDGASEDGAAGEGGDAAESDAGPDSGE